MQELALKSVGPLLSVPPIKTPGKLPKIVPLPPLSEVPPRTAAGASALKCNA